jgi:hypothetical protein
MASSNAPRVQLTAIAQIHEFGFDSIESTLFPGSCTASRETNPT